MTNLLRGLALAFLFGLMTTVSAGAAGISLGGAVMKPSQISVSDLQGMPPATVASTFDTDHGAESGSYTGVLLWTILENAGVMDDPRGHLRHVILVTGSDQYTVALSIGEIDPKFEGKEVIVAYQKDGKPLDAANGLRLIVPGDKHGGRAVKNVMHIEVK